MTTVRGRGLRRAQLMKLQRAHRTGLLSNKQPINAHIHQPQDLMVFTGGNSKKKKKIPRTTQKRAHVLQRRARGGRRRQPPLRHERSLSAAQLLAAGTFCGYNQDPPAAARRLQSSLLSV